MQLFLSIRSLRLQIRSGLRKWLHMLIVYFSEVQVHWLEWNSAIEQSVWTVHVSLLWQQAKLLPNVSISSALPRAEQQSKRQQIWIIFVSYRSLHLDWATLCRPCGLVHLLLEMAAVPQMHRILPRKATTAFLLPLLLPRTPWKRLEA